VALGFRFVYGLRIVTPVVLGMSRVPTAHFIVLNLVGAAVWSVAVGLLGYFFGAVLTLVVGEVRAYLGAALMVLLGTGLLLWAVSAWRTGRRDRGQRE
jgi:membrane protein DedA with SNARE-associated domain